MRESTWDDTATLWFLVRQVAAGLDRAGETLYRDGLGVSLAQFLVLSVVDAYPGPINQQRVADRLGLTKGTVSRQLERCIAQGLMTVAVSPHSRRENDVSLTAEGTRVVRRGDVLARSALQADMPEVDAADLTTTLSVLSALNASLGGVQPPN